MRLALHPDDPPTDQLRGGARLVNRPDKVRQMEQLKRTIQAVGRAGIPIMGYNFSIAGVWGWTKGPFGRGGAKALVYDESKIDKSTPLPNGMVWNMVYDPDAPEGTVAPISSEEIWQRLEWFLSQILPVARRAACGSRSTPTTRRPTSCAAARAS